MNYNLPMNNLVKINPNISTTQIVDMSDNISIIHLVDTNIDEKWVKNDDNNVEGKCTHGCINEDGEDSTTISCVPGTRNGRGIDRLDAFPATILDEGTKEIILNYNQNDRKV